MTPNNVNDLIGPVSGRSFERLKIEDLHCLAKLANKKLMKTNTGREYRNRLLMLCLCQGAAEHFICKKHGVKDFDVWAFYEKDHKKRFPRFLCRCDSDGRLLRFGTHPDDYNYRGRHIDIMGREIQYDSSQNTQDCIRKWLQTGDKENKKRKRPIKKEEKVLHSSPWHIAQRPVITIFPREECGTIIWDPTKPNNS